MLQKSFITNRRVKSIPAHTLRNRCIVTVETIADDLVHDTTARLMLHCPTHFMLYRATEIVLDTAANRVINGA